MNGLFKGGRLGLVLEDTYTMYSDEANFIDATIFGFATYIVYKLHLSGVDTFSALELFSVSRDLMENINRHRRNYESVYKIIVENAKIHGGYWIGLSQGFRDF
jgi:hypothetical protein